jgi:hypothetical protein
MKGSTYKRCACKGADGRQLGTACPRLRGTGMAPGTTLRAFRASPTR